MDTAEHYKISLKFREIERPLNFKVKNSEEERVLREAVKMTNSYFDEYKTMLAGVDNTTYYAMVALLLARKYIETSESNKELELSLEQLEKEIQSYLNENR